MGRKYTLRCHIVFCVKYRNKMPERWREDMKIAKELLQEAGVNIMYVQR